LTSQNRTGRESLARNSSRRIRGGVKRMETCERIPGKAERDKLREEKQPNHDEKAIR